MAATQRANREHALDVQYIPFDWENQREAGIIDCANSLLFLLTAGSAAPQTVPGDHTAFFGHGDIILLGGVTGALSRRASSSAMTEAEERPGLGPLDTAFSFGQCPDGRQAVLAKHQPQLVLSRIGGTDAMVASIDGAFFAHLPVLLAMLRGPTLPPAMTTGTR